MTKTHGQELLARFDALDAMLVKAGWPATTRWWRKQIQRFLLSGRRRWILRVGRRGGKSSTLCRLAYVIARWGAHKIPPSDCGFVMFISKDRDEAAQRLFTIGKIAEVVGDKLDAKGDELRIRGRRTGFKVFTATIAGVSGPTAIAIIGDEVAKWKDADTGANPADEVISSAGPCGAGQPESFEVWSSSAFGVDDSHARMFDGGNTRHQVVSFAPTWIARPSITEEETHDLEPKHRVWAREYAAIPQASALGVFDPEDIDRAFDREVPIDYEDSRNFGRPVLIVDASRGRKDTFAWCVARAARGSDGREYVDVAVVDGVAGARGVLVEDIIAKAAAEAKAWKVRDVYGDSYDVTGMKLGFRQHRLSFHEREWTEDSKADAVETLDRWLAEDVIIVPGHEVLKRELYRFEEKINRKSGSFTYAGRGSSHDDFVAILLTMTMVKLPRVGTAPDGSYSDRLVQLPPRCVSPVSGFQDYPFDDGPRDPFGPMNLAYLRSRGGGQ